MNSKQRRAKQIVERLRRLHRKMVREARAERWAATWGRL